MLADVGCWPFALRFHCELFNDIIFLCNNTILLRKHDKLVGDKCLGDNLFKLFEFLISRLARQHNLSVCQYYMLFN